jgi:hypothetical protein
MYILIRNIVILIIFDYYLQMLRTKSIELAYYLHSEETIQEKVYYFDAAYLLVYYRVV